ncbi:similar to Saccharomyces cerevisiae YJL076W NET1 Core subunit of the RENT complex, which is a complex involved in nucleolar silencing and telophase exit [Maudiozyma saulgeensis]|uniref:Similar to Saccharomyces cerevisiae YJL076W NET1 Core subunit of the RENT complex, which is a complex involved in nucleolar silencing and telophase exit n=1 Tax=Maudiozyma saulgeensis TaxID=1789683 RepID=A0A1X7R0Q8_9SACH|nr:similar to Saccharomyces cerevisiae YJL076W NET1 Core subunit of the RENT complex, which is a complex involved in nucleolar silencing and telophase exit [Kazachstania saulgeensis]
MYKLQVILVPPSARDSLVPGNFRVGSVDSFPMMMPGQNMNPSNPQQTMESGTQFQNGPMNNENTMNFNSSFMTPLYQAPVNTKKFLHFTKPSNSLLILSEEIQKKCEKMYPNLTETIDILSIQDSTGCDLDPDFIVKDVFNMDNIVKVILSDELESDENSNTSLYQSNKRRKLNESKLLNPVSAPQQAQNQQNSILNVVKKRSGPSTVKSSVNNNNNLRISTPLANQIYPLNNQNKVSNNSDDEDEMADRSFLPPPNQPQSPPIRISSGIDNYKRIRNTVEDTVSRSETVDPDKSKQQRMFSGTPVRTMMTPNRVTLTGQRVMSENLGNDASSRQGLVFASTSNKLPLKALSPIFTPRIASGSLTIPEPKISEVEKELREGPASPSSILPPKASKIPMKKPYIEKSPTPETDSSTDTDDELRQSKSPSFINDNSSSKDSPFNQQSSSQAEIATAIEPIKDVKKYRGLSDSKTSRIESTIRRKSSLETKLLNKSFTTFTQNGKEEELRRMDHFSDEDEEDEENHLDIQPDAVEDIPFDDKLNEMLEPVDSNDVTDDEGINDTVQHIELPNKTSGATETSPTHPSIHKADLLNMVGNASPVNLLHEKKNILRKPFDASTFNNVIPQPPHTKKDTFSNLTSKNSAISQESEQNKIANDDSLLFDTENASQKNTLNNQSAGNQKTDLYSLFLKRQENERPPAFLDSNNKLEITNYKLPSKKTTGSISSAKGDSNIIVSQDPDTKSSVGTEKSNGKLIESEKNTTKSMVSPPNETVVTNAKSNISTKSQLSRIPLNKASGKSPIAQKIMKVTIESDTQGQSVNGNKRAASTSLINQEKKQKRPENVQSKEEIPKKQQARPTATVTKKNQVTSKTVMELANSPISEKLNRKSISTVTSGKESDIEAPVKNAVVGTTDNIRKGDISSVQVIREKLNAGNVSKTTMPIGNNDSSSEEDENGDEEEGGRNIIIQSLSQNKTLNVEKFVNKRAETKSSELQKVSISKPKTDAKKKDTVKAATVKQKKSEPKQPQQIKQDTTKDSTVKLGPILATPSVANKVPDMTGSNPHISLKNKDKLPTAMNKKKTENDENTSGNESSTEGSNSSSGSSDESSEENDSSDDESNRSINLVKKHEGSKRTSNGNNGKRVIKSNSTEGKKTPVTRGGPSKSKIFQTPEYLESESDSESETDSKQNEKEKPIKTTGTVKSSGSVVVSKLEQKMEKKTDTISPKTINPNEANVPEMSKDTSKNLKSSPTVNRKQKTESNSSSSSEDNSPNGISSSEESSDESSSSSDEDDSVNSRKSRRKIVAPPKGKVNSRVPSQKNSNDTLFKESDMVTSTQREPAEKVKMSEISKRKTPVNKTSATIEDSIDDVADLPKKIRPSLISLSDLASRGIPDVKDKSKLRNGRTEANKSVGNNSQIKGGNGVSDESESESSSSSDSDSDSDKNSSNSKSDSDSDSDSSDSSSSSSSDEEASFINAKSASAALGKRKKKLSGGFASLLKQSKRK